MPNSLRADGQNIETDQVTERQGLKDIAFELKQVTVGDECSSDTEVGSMHIDAECSDRTKKAA